jgi:hypothetical protein
MDGRSFHGGVRKRPINFPEWPSTALHENSACEYWVLVKSKNGH